MHIRLLALSLKQLCRLCSENAVFVGVDIYTHVQTYARIYMHASARA